MTSGDRLFDPFCVSDRSVDFTGTLRIPSGTLVTVRVEGLGNC